MYKTLPLPPHLTFYAFWHIANYVLTTHGQPELDYGQAEAWYHDYKLKFSRKAMAEIRSKVAA